MSSSGFVQRSSPQVPENDGDAQEPLLRTGEDTSTTASKEYGRGCCLPCWAVILITLIGVLVVGGVIAAIVYFCAAAAPAVAPDAVKPIRLQGKCLVAERKNIDVFLVDHRKYIGGPTGQNIGISSEMAVLDDRCAYDLSNQDQRLHARAAYEERGFAYVRPPKMSIGDITTNINNPLNMPMQLNKGPRRLGSIENFYKLDAGELKMLEISDEWAQWVKEQLIRKGGLTVLPPTSASSRKDPEDGSEKKNATSSSGSDSDSIFSETSPAARVWNEHYSNADRLQTGRTTTKDDPLSFGWAGAGNAACEVSSFRSNPFKFYRECPPSLWDAVWGNGAKRLKHLQEVFNTITKGRRHQGARRLLRGQNQNENVNTSTQKTNSHDRALFVFNALARDADPRARDIENKRPLPVVHADTTLENAVSGVFQLRHQTLYSSPEENAEEVRILSPNLNYGTGLSLLGYYNALLSVGSFEGAWENLFKEDRVKKVVGEEVCGLGNADFEFISQNFLVSDIDHAFRGEIVMRESMQTPEGFGRMEHWVLFSAFLHKLHKLEVRGAVLESDGAARPHPDVVSNKTLLEDVLKPNALKIVQGKVLPFMMRSPGVTTSDMGAAQDAASRILSEPDVIHRVLRAMDEFMSPEKMEKWACFFGRLRVHDAYNVWVNLTPPEEGKTDLPRRLRNPMAVLDPFTMSRSQTEAHSVAFPSDKHWNGDGADEIKKKNNWYFRPGMYFGEALWFNTNVTYHTAVRDMPGMGDERKSIESRVIVVDTCVKDVHITGEEKHFSLLELQKQCWGKTGGGTGGALIK